VAGERDACLDRRWLVSEAGQEVAQNLLPRLSDRARGPVGYSGGSYAPSLPSADMNLRMRSVTSSDTFAISTTLPSGPKTGAFTPLQYEQTRAHLDVVLLELPRVGLPRSQDPPQRRA
jgi:hypothetical protein